jgi:cell division protein FtsL
MRTVFHSAVAVVALSLSLTLFALFPGRLLVAEVCHQVREALLADEAEQGELEKSVETLLIQARLLDPVHEIID